MIKKALILFCLLTAMVLPAAAQGNYFKNWPEGADPKTVGKRLAENWLGRKFDFETRPTRAAVIYPEVCATYGAMNVASLSKDSALQAKLIAKYDRFLGDDAKYISPNRHVDYSVFGVAPLEIYLLNKDARFLKIGQGLADAQWATPTPDGITSEARYWIDDMYMITALQVQAYRATKDKKYLDRAALTMAAYLDKLQQPNGLFFHALESKFYWSRGDGWVAAGMAELLSKMPKNHPKYDRIMKGYREMMATLLKVQAPEGFWRQLLDVPESWMESSGTGMFTFSMVTGVKKGWLDAKTYGPAARKAWIALVNNLDENANVKNVCIGTNKGPSVEYYLARERKTGDLHGQAAMLWASMALLKK
jgi:unsaturated rhamnogalacturonyl hydrolase